jgi:hypothetical protein
MCVKHCSCFEDKAIIYVTLAFLYCRQSVCTSLIYFLRSVLCFKSPMKDKTLFSVAFQTPLFSLCQNLLKEFCKPLWPSIQTFLVFFFLALNFAVILKSQSCLFLA